MRASIAPKDPALRKRWLYTVRNKYLTIRQYAETLITLVHEHDSDGREIGFDYEYIRNSILQKFPVVLRNGPHKGKPTKMPYKELQEFACELNRQGVRLPFRPRRKARIDCDPKAEKTRGAETLQGNTKRSSRPKSVRSHRKRKGHARAI